jgi:hypothetical protein
MKIIIHKYGSVGQVDIISSSFSFLDSLRQMPSGGGDDILYFDQRTSIESNHNGEQDD